MAQQKKLINCFELQYNTIEEFNNQNRVYKNIV